MIFNKPPNNVKISTGYSAMDGVHDFFFLLGKLREWCSKIDVSTAVHRNRLFIVAIEQSFLE
jgi:hypothetical protein